MNKIDKNRSISFNINRIMKKLPIPSITYINGEPFLFLKIDEDIVNNEKHNWDNVKYNLYNDIDVILRNILPYNIMITSILDDFDNKNGDVIRNCIRKSKRFFINNGYNNIIEINKYIDQYCPYICKIPLFAINPELYEYYKEKSKQANYNKNY